MLRRFVCVVLQNEKGDHRRLEPEEAMKRRRVGRAEPETEEARLGKEEGKRLAQEVLTILKRAWKYDGFVSFQIDDADYFELTELCRKELRP